MAASRSSKSRSASHLGVLPRCVLLSTLLRSPVRAASTASSLPAKFLISFKAILGRTLAEECEDSIGLKLSQEIQFGTEFGIFLGTSGQCSGRSSGWVPGALSFSVVCERNLVTDL